MKLSLLCSVFGGYEAIRMSAKVVDSENETNRAENLV